MSFQDRVTSFMRAIVIGLYLHLGCVGIGLTYLVVYGPPESLSFLPDLRSLRAAPAVAQARVHGQEFRVNTSQRFMQQYQPQYQLASAQSGKGIVQGAGLKFAPVQTGQLQVSPSFETGPLTGDPIFIPAPAPTLNPVFIPMPAPAPAPTTIAPAPAPSPVPALVPGTTIAPAPALLSPINSAADDSLFAPGAPLIPLPSSKPESLQGSSNVTVNSQSRSNLPSGKRLAWIVPDVTLDDQTNAGHLAGRRYCAISFDDGPEPIKDAQILEILHQYQVPATFFVLGQKVRQNADLVQRMVREGHEVGNHSWSHPQLTKLSTAKVRSEIEKTSNALADIGIQSRVFRPPYGDHNARVRSVSKSLGMHTVLWDIDSLDWKLKSAPLIKRQIFKDVDVGSMVLMHSQVRGTVEALPGIIEEMYAKGCEFVTTSQWLAGLNQSGYTPPLN